MLGVMGAMKVEVHTVLDALESTSTLHTLGQEITRGEVAGAPVLVAQSGIGKVNAALAVAGLVQAGATQIVFTGMAGGVGTSIHIGDAVVATSLVQHDVDLTDFGYEIGRIPDEPLAWPADRTLVSALTAAATGLGATVHLGCIASGDQFIADRARAAAIAKLFDALAVEMEGAAAAQAAAHCGVPLAVLRWISDTADEASPTDSSAFNQRVGELDLGVVRAIVPALAGQV
ncbi:MAG: 5'-methylthioadenosine/adenosylhomocysteine nucleosidase [Propionibacteriaceae bacterium]|nr:5'-methylthioadenosine/adenosylhomocysteine nucleosidase [Propionibacteriaceae bacterium]